MSSEIKETQQSAPVVDNRDYELRVTDEQREKKKKWAEIWDKFTTGLLIVLMSSPILILGYIFTWFLTK